MEWTIIEKERWYWSNGVGKDYL